jgi:hypothetical protein
MANTKTPAETKVREAMAALEFRPLTIEDALDPQFGKRFDVDTGSDDLIVAGNWNDEASLECDTRMGLVEAVLLDDPSDPTSGKAHLRGFTLQPKRGRPPLSHREVIYAADLVNDEFMTAGMAFAEHQEDEPIRPFLLIMHTAGRTQKDRREIITRTCSAIGKKWKNIRTVGAVVSPSRYVSEQVSEISGVDPAIARPLIEDHNTDLLRDIDAKFETIPLRIATVNHDQASMAMGRMLAGEDLSTILAAPNISTADEVGANAGKTPVPTALLHMFMDLSDGRSMNVEQSLALANDIANVHLIDTTPDTARNAVIPGKPFNMVATILGASIYFHAQAFHTALMARDETTAILMKLRELGFVVPVMAIAGGTPVITTRGDYPKFDPSFADRIQDLYASVVEMQT